MRERLVHALMDARRSIAMAKRIQSGDAERDARAAVDQAKRALGERGPVWWDDGAPDFNRRVARGTPYAAWAASVESPAAM